MTAHQNDCKRILDFIYGNPTLPADLRERLAEWLLAHENDENLTGAMSKLWNEHLEEEHGAFDADGLQHLLSEVEVKQVRTPFWKRMWRYTAAVVVAISVLAGVYSLGLQHSDTETVLLVAAGSKGEYILPDSTRVWLNGDTRLCYGSDDFTSEHRRVRVDGEAYFEVVKDSLRPFNVQMTAMEVEVLGTSFDVRNYEFSRTEEVVLKEGAVRVTTNCGPAAHELRPDQRLVIDRGTGTIVISDEDATNYCNWYRHKIRFEGAPLGDILKQVCRRYSLDLVVAPDVDTSLKLSLTVSNDDAPEVMRAIAMLADLEFTICNNTLEVYK